MLRYIFTLKLFNPISKKILKINDKLISEKYIPYSTSPTLLITWHQFLKYKWFNKIIFKKIINTKFERKARLKEQINSFIFKRT